MSNTNTNRVSNYRPVVATMTIQFESNLSNDALRSPTFWRDRLGRIGGIRSVDVNLNRNQVRITRNTR